MKTGKKVLSGIGILVMAVGIGLILCSGLLVWHNTQESAEVGEYSHGVALQLSNEIDGNPMMEYLSNPEFIPDYKLNPNMEMPTTEINGDLYIGEIVIPELDLELGVMDWWSYDGLRKAPGRYFGTPYTGTFVICAHNYKAHFGTIKNLVAGDKVLFRDVDGNEFEYEVQDVQEINPSPDTQATESGYDLVLTTCTLGGKTRWAVFCNLV